VWLVSKIDALDKLCRHLGMYEDKLRIMGLERELAELSDEEIVGRLIELRGKDYRRIDDPATERAAAAAPVLPAAPREERRPGEAYPVCSGCHSSLGDES
jgi:hypothetical protein